VLVMVALVDVAPATLVVVVVVGGAVVHPSRAAYVSKLLLSTSSSCVNCCVCRTESTVKVKRSGEHTKISAKTVV
jgi:hypothetical protein